MLLSRITWPQAATSLLANLSISAGVQSFSTVPSWLARSRVTSIFAILRIAAFSRSMIGCGVPAGTNSANQPSSMKPGRPASAVVGMSGNAGCRCSLASASAFTAPLRMCAETEGGVTISSSTWPATRSAVAGPAPL